MNKFILSCFILLLAIILPNNAQKYIGDTITVEYNPLQAIPASFCLQDISDIRDDGSLVSITEKKRYLFMPVDRYYVLPSSLGEVLVNSVSSPDSNECKKNFLLTIEYFAVNERKNSFLPAQILNTKIDVSEFHNDSVYKVGSLVYETEIKKNEVKGKPEVKLEELVRKWNKQLANDLNTISYTDSTVYKTIIPRLRTDEFQYKKQLFTTSIFTVGIDWYTVEGEINFAYPESDNMYIRTPKNVRYRHMKNFESLEFGSINDHFCYQWKPNIKLDLAGKLFIGINRWNDMETVKHKLEEILLLDFSLNQTILFYSPKKKGIYGGLGLTEDFLYIQENPFMFRPGFHLQIGLKL